MCHRLPGFLPMLRGRTDSLAPDVTAEACDPERLLETMPEWNALHTLKTYKNAHKHTHIIICTHKRERDTHTHIYIACILHGEIIEICIIYANISDSKQTCETETIFDSFSQLNSSNERSDLFLMCPSDEPAHWICMILSDKPVLCNL